VLYGHMLGQEVGQDADAGADRILLAMTFFSSAAHGILNLNTDGLTRRLSKRANSTQIRGVLDPSACPTGDEGGSMITLSINGETHQVDVEPDTPLLWVLRDNIGLTGTKYGCGIAYCGACSVHIDGVVTRSCQLPISAVGDAEVTTIEGLSPDSDHPVQQAWREEDVPQCGYCQSGQIMAVAALLAENPAPSDEDIDQQLTNICRCGTYARIRKAVHRAAEIARA
jgi:isoquinoline 1-oxidoreductase subunit alpha